MLNFKQHLWLAKRKTNWRVAGNVGYRPTLPLSAIRQSRPPHVYNLNRSADAINAIHSAYKNYNHDHSNAV